MKKIFAFLLVLVLGSCLVSAAAADGQYGVATIVMPEDVCTGNYDGLYAGNMVNGKASGDGGAVFPFGAYTGKFKNGVPDGKGTFYFSDGKSTSGTFTWTSGLRFYMEGPTSGSGPTYSGTGITYVGMLKNGDPWGYGCMDFDNGGTFYGEFEDGYVRGSGTYVYMNNAQKPITADNWNLVSRVNSSYGGRWYTGLVQGKTWQGFGMLCYNYSYYVGEVRDIYCSGYGEYWQWKTSGDPSGTLTLKERGVYSSGNLVSANCYPTPRY